MTLSEWMNILLGTGTLGFLGLLIKLFVIDKKKADTDNAKTKTEIKKSEIEIGDAELKQLREKTKIVTELLQDAEQKDELVRKALARESELQIQKQTLMIELTGAKHTIGYQEKERKDWMEMLKTTLDANAKRELEFNELIRQVGELKKSEKNCQDTVSSLEGRLNIVVGILHQNNLQLPEGFVWTHSETHQVYPIQTPGTLKEV